MFYQLFLTLIGLGMLLAGGELLVRGATRIANTIGIPGHIIGLTVVAFGTSAPELFINGMAAYHQTSEISFGNVIGSNICNIGLILGVCALIRPLQVQSTLLTREIPMLILASLASLVLAADPFLRGGVACFDHADGIILLLFFCIFLYYTVSAVIRQKSFDSLMKQSGDINSFKNKERNKFFHIVFLAGGLFFLVIGGEVSVTSAVSLATYFMVPEEIIGLTVIAIGTSLPELVTSAIATWKGQVDIAVGNVIGSNIFNLLFILGVSGSIHPVMVPGNGGMYDLIFMFLLTLLLLPLSLTNARKFVRWEGGIFLMAYFVYNIWRTLYY